MSDSKGAAATFDLLSKSTDALAREIGEEDLDDPVRTKRVKEPHHALCGTSASLIVAMMVWSQGCIPMKTDVAVFPHSAFNVSVGAGEKVAILFSPDAAREISSDFGEQMVHCVHDAASKAALPVTLLQQQEVYEALFPDLSPKQVVIRSDTLPLLVSEPEIRDRIDRLKLRYLILIGGESEEHSSGGGVPYIVMGAGWDRRVQLRAQVFELEHGTEVGAVGSQTKAGGFAGLIFIIPMGWASFDAERRARQSVKSFFATLEDTPMPTDAPTPNRRCSQWQFYGLRLLLFTSWLSVLAGCGTLIPEPVLVREPRPHQTPFIVGVYYPETFRELIYKPPPPPLFADSMSIGNASVKLFDEALALLFKQVVRVPGPPSTGTFPANVAGVIEPSISTVNLWDPWHPPLGQPCPSATVCARVSITYAFTLSTPEGERLAAWKVEGEGVYIAGDYESWNTVVKDSFERAMREAAWKLVSGFRDVPEVAPWLELHGAK